MLQKIRKLFGMKTYVVEIKWNTGEKELISVQAWSPVQAITKVASMRDVVDKAKLTIPESINKNI